RRHDHRRADRLPRGLQGHHRSHPDTQARAPVMDHRPADFLPVRGAGQPDHHHRHRVLAAQADPWPSRALALCRHRGDRRQRWSPFSGLTTTSLWIGGQITAAGIITGLVLPSLVLLLVPLIILSFRMHGEAPRPRARAHLAENIPPTTARFARNLVLTLDLGS